MIKLKIEKTIKLPMNVINKQIIEEVSEKDKELLGIELNSNFASFSMPPLSQDDVRIGEKVTQSVSTC